MTFSTIQARCVGSRRDVTTAFEEFQGLTVTLPAHFKSSRCVRFSDEIVGVRFAFVGLRRVAAVTTITAHSGAFVNRTLEDRDYLAGLVFLPAMTVDAAVWSLNIGSAVIKYTNAHQ
jgi:hypothetical protein